MKTITKTYNVYEFSELSEDAQQTAIESFRDINVDGEFWSGCVLDEWTIEKLPEQGFNNAEISYSGFWSQGDGASFVADIDILKFMKFHHLCNKYRSLYNFMTSESESCYIAGKVVRSTHQYCHEYTVGVEIDGHYYDKVPDKATEQAEKMNGEILEVVQNLSRKIYRELESEYDGQVSDEAVKDTILCNEYTFDESGNRKS